MYKGIIQKMFIKHNNPVDYSFIIADTEIPLNGLIGEKIQLNWGGVVQCMCGKQFSKFYRQSFCYQCYWNMPQASPSIFKPELCTADLGVEERDLEWESNFQIAPHYVYLANSSGLKVGITRKNQKKIRWMDQGASQAIILAEVPNRRLSGLIEIELKKEIADKTNWRKMLSGKPTNLDLIEEKIKCLDFIPDNFHEFIYKDDTVTSIIYPVNRYPKKIKSISLQKESMIEGELVGIKGQYLLFNDDRVFNVRSHQGYIIDILI